MRALAPLLLVVAACKPSATVQSTMPIANLQSHQSVSVRVHTNAFAIRGSAEGLQNSIIAQLRQRCGFATVNPVTRNPADLKLDVTITQTRRGDGGVINNPNLAVVDTLVVLSDGQAGDLLGTVRIRGKSSGMMVNNSVPEHEALGVVAQTVGDLLAKSGCTGPRVAKAVPPPQQETPPPNPNNPGPVIDEAKRPQAEQLNDQGKEKLYAADLPGALALFQQAVALVPDAKYQFNVCLTLGAQEQWNPALDACRQAKGMNPPSTLGEKIDRRIDLLGKHQ